MALQTTLHSPMTTKIENFHQILDKCPSRNVRNLCSIMLKYAEAEASCSRFEPAFPSVWQREIQLCMDKYHNERDQNTKEDEIDMLKLESNLEELEFRYHTAEKLRKYGLHDVHISRNKQFRELPWELILRLMEEEKQLPTAFTKDDLRKSPPISVTGAFNIAFRRAKQTERLREERMPVYPAVPPVADVFRCHCDLLNLARSIAESKVEGMPKFTELRTSRRWSELFARVEDLEKRIQKVILDNHVRLKVLEARLKDLGFHREKVIPIEVVLDELLQELWHYKNTWFQKSEVGIWDLSHCTEITSVSTIKDRTCADLNRLMKTCGRKIAGHKECLDLIMDYGPSVVDSRVAERKLDTWTVILMASKPSTVSRKGSNDGWVEVTSGIEQRGDQDMFGCCRIRGCSRP